MNLACAAHFLATTHLEPGRFEAAEPLLETDRTANPMRDEMFATSVALADGMATVPTTPGT